MTQTDFELPQRTGEPPNVNPGMPHLQLTDNAGDEVYQQLAVWLFGLDHVEEGRSRVSLPSSRAQRRLRDWKLQQFTIPGVLAANGSRKAPPVTAPWYFTQDMVGTLVVAP